MVFPIFKPYYTGLLINYSNENAGKLLLAINNKSIQLFN